MAPLIPLRDPLVEYISASTIVFWLKLFHHPVNLFLPAIDWVTYLSKGE